MNILDIIILICLIPVLVQGLREGFIAQIIAIISIIAGVWLSFRFASITSEWLSQYIQTSGQILKVVSFALIFILVILCLAAIGKVLEATVRIVMLGWLNKLLGALFSLLKFGLVAGLIIMVFNSLNNTFGFISEERLADSVLYPPMKNIAYTVFPYLKEMLFWNK